MRFTELLTEIKATYPTEPRKFHVLATRFYLGVDSLAELKSMQDPVEYGFEFQQGTPILSPTQVETIIRNR